MIEGRTIGLADLPSKGVSYPKDIEILVKPLTMKEELTTSMERYGVSKSNYYENLLDSIEIKGTFNKKDIIYGDLQYIDLVRRLNSFELEEKLSIKGVKCSKCEKPIEVDFMFPEIVVNDFDKDDFDKEFVFSDGLTVIVSPVKTRSFLKVTRTYLTNSSEYSDMVNFLFAFRASSVVKVKDRDYNSLDKMHDYIFDYLSGLYKNSDRKVLEKLDKSISTSIEPLNKKCFSCGNMQEVGIEPQTRFQQ